MSCFRSFHLVRSAVHPVLYENQGWFAPNSEHDLLCPSVDDSVGEPMSLITPYFWWYPLCYGLYPHLIGSELSTGKTMSRYFDINYQLAFSMGSSLGDTKSAPIGLM